MKKIRKVLFEIADYFALAYNPDRWAIGLPNEERLKKQAPKGRNESDNIVQTPAGAMYKKEEADTNTVEFEKVNIGNDRINKLTLEDEVQLQMQGIDLTSDKALAKALDIKRLWASEMTNGQIVDYFNGKRGYSERTIKTYTAAFSKAVQNGAVNT